MTTEQHGLTQIFRSKAIARTSVFIGVHPWLIIFPVEVPV